MSELPIDSELKSAFNHIFSKYKSGKSINF